MPNIKEESDYGQRNPEQRKTHATGEHERVTDDADSLQTGFTRSPVTGVSDRYADDGVRRNPNYNHTIGSEE